MARKSGDDIYHMTRPGRYALVMVLFLIIAALIAAALFDRILDAFAANIFLNGLILGVLLVGIIYTFVQIFRLNPSVRWIEHYRMDDHGAPGHMGGHHDYPPPDLVAPMAAMLRDRSGPTSLSATALGSILDSIGSRLDESREISRYMIGLLVFLGLLGTFWGLLQTISSVSDTIGALAPAASASGSNAAETIFADLIAGLEAPLSGMAIAFSSSLFGLSGSLILGFLDLRAGQAQNRFYNELEEYLSTRTHISTDGDSSGGNGNMSGLDRDALGALYGAIRSLERTIADQSAGVSYRTTENFHDMSEDAHETADETAQTPPKSDDEIMKDLRSLTDHLPPSTKRPR
jgi:hypothetical protein